MTELLDRLQAVMADRYQVEREVGRGGMATVYLAQDLRHGRPVALKVLHPQLAVSLGPDRFLREIQIAARLQHPHIVPLYDSGRAGDLLYYVMPFVEGVSLRQLASSAVWICTHASRYDPGVALALNPLAARAQFIIMLIPSAAPVGLGMVAVMRVTVPVPLPTVSWASVPCSILGVDDIFSPP